MDQNRFKKAINFGYYYLSNSEKFKNNNIKIKFLLPNEMVKDEMANNYKIILGVQDQINNIEKKLNLDIALNVNSFSEMSKKDCFFYINKINELDISNIYHQKSNHDILPDNKHTHQEIISSDFPFKDNKYKLKLVNISPWLGVDGKCREYFYKRI